MRGGLEARARTRPRGIGRCLQRSSGEEKTTIRVIRYKQRSFRVRLKSASLLAFLGLSLFFVRQTLGTFEQRLFVNLTIVRLTMLLSVLSILAILVFYIRFSRDYVRAECKRLKTAASWVIAGYVAMTILYLRDFIKINKIDFLSGILQSRIIETVAPFVPLLSALLALVFFATLYSQTAGLDQGEFRRAKLSALVGSSVAVAVRILVILNYLRGGIARWYFELGRASLAVAFPLVLLAFLGMAYFYLSFYRGRDLL
jgi:hypothetical protein